MKFTGPRIAPRWLPQPWGSNIRWTARFEVNNNGYVTSVHVNCLGPRNKLLGQAETHIFRTETEDLLATVRNLMVDAATQQLSFDEVEPA